MTDGYPAGRHARGGALPWLFGGAVIVVAVFGIAFAVVLTGNSTPSGSGHHKQQALAAASPPSATASAASPSPSVSSHKPSAKNSHSAPPSPSATALPSPQPKPTHPPVKPKPPGTVQLAASISANGWGSTPSGGRVAFQVNDTGSAATGTVTVSITLPAGASMTNGRGGGDAVLTPFVGAEAALTPFDSGGWNCQPTSTGATCTHGGIAAGNQAWGEIFFTVSAGTACGQPVDLTAASGSASASAQSSVSC